MDVTIKWDYDERQWAAWIGDFDGLTDPAETGSACIVGVGKTPDEARTNAINGIAKALQDLKQCSGSLVRPK